MIVAELFYPSNLKSVIANADEHGNLNRQALDKLNRFIHRNLLVLLPVIFVFLAVAIFISKDVSISILLVTLAIAIVIGSSMNVTSLIHQITKLYETGQVTEAEVIKSFKGGGIGGARWKIVFHYCDDPEKAVYSSLNIPNYFFQRKYEAGEKIKILYNPRDRLLSIPIVSKLENTFNISNRKR